MAIRSTALAADEFQREIASLTEHGRVIVRLDACHSGATTGSGATLAADADRLRELMRSPNVTVLTSSTADQLSVEDKQWRNGAFTEAVLEALTTRADEDRNGLISMVEMTRYLDRPGAGDHRRQAGPGDRHPFREQRLRRRALRRRGTRGRRDMKLQAIAAMILALTPAMARTSLACLRVEGFRMKKIVLDRLKSFGFVLGSSKRRSSSGISYLAATASGSR